MFFSVPIAPADKGDKSPGNCISIRFFRWFFAVFTTSLESQAINEPEGARALFIVCCRELVFLRPPGAWRARLGLGLIWIMLLQILLSLYEGHRALRWR